MSDSRVLSSSAQDFYHCAACLDFKILTFEHILQRIVFCSLSDAAVQTQTNYGTSETVALCKLAPMFSAMTSD